MEKIIKIIGNSIPILIMVGLIPFVKNDYLLVLYYLLFIFVMFKTIKYTKNDTVVFVLGFVVMTISEYFFINTGVETFNRNSLFGVMPVWLPFLWASGFVSIKRSMSVLDSK